MNNQTSIPTYNRIKIFEVDKLPLLKEFFSIYFPKYKNEIGFYVFKLYDYVPEDIKKRYVIYASCPEPNSPIYKLCLDFCNNKIDLNSLNPYLLN